MLLIALFAMVGGLSCTSQEQSARTGESTRPDTAAGAPAPRTATATAALTVPPLHKVDEPLALSGEGRRDEAAPDDLLSRFKTTNALTLKTDVMARSIDPSAIGEIIGFNPDAGRNFALFQEGDKLTFWLRTSGTGVGGKRYFVGQLAAMQRVSVTITVSGGRLDATLDGVVRVDAARIEGDFSSWAEGTLIYGKGWNGVLGPVEYYDHAL